MKVRESRKLINENNIKCFSNDLSNFWKIFEQVVGSNKLFVTGSCG